MAAVAPMATAPQNTTLSIGLKIPAPPVRAPMAPRSASATSEPPDTIHGICAGGDNTAISSGSAAPAENVTAEVAADDVEGVAVDQGRQWRLPWQPALGPRRGQDQRRHEQLADHEAPT